MISLSGKGKETEAGRWSGGVKMEMSPGGGLKAHVTVPISGNDYGND